MVSLNAAVFQYSSNTSMKFVYDLVVKLEMAISQTAEIFNRCNEIKCRDQSDVGPQKVELGCWVINVGLVGASKSIFSGVIVLFDQLYAYKVRYDLFRCIVLLLFI